jgi:DNA processing protein
MPIQRLENTSESWPIGLNSTWDPPKSLYIRGALPVGQGVAVVGTRRMTPYGAACVRLLVPELVRLGRVVVSGLALGVDGAAHRTCLDAGGRTVAVLGTGIDDDTIYPRSHFALAKEIIKSGGALISEYPEGTRGFKSNFPARNRIVVGLSEVVLVIEAPRKSGAMITARLGLDAGREVWAVPGPITSEMSWGPNELIRNGATPITAVEDIAHALGLAPNVPHQTEMLLSETERAVTEALRPGPLSADEIGRACGLDPAAAALVLTELEIKGVVVAFGMGRFVLYP